MPLTSTPEEATMLTGTATQDPVSLSSSQHSSSTSSLLTSSSLLRKGFADVPWQVHKFGGTSVANADCYRIVAQIIEDQIEIGGDCDSSTATTQRLAVTIDAEDILRAFSGTHLAVVVSAMGGKPKVTDLLLDTVKFASERSQHKVQQALNLLLSKHQQCLQDLFGQANASECDRLMAIIQQDINDIQDILKTVSLMKWQATRISELVSGYGELWSAQILTALMRLRWAQSPHQFVYLDARRIITVDEEAIQHGAIVWDISADKMKQVYDEERSKLSNQQVLHFVITGYVASNTHGVSTTLQRDGSDYSAAIMGRLLQSNNITIWTDVDGVLSADPRRVPLAQVVREVSYDEAMELAYFGAKVIHPKTMQPAISSNPQIPIYIRNTFNSAFRGTRIYTRSVTIRDDDKVVCGFSSIEHMAIINVEGSGLIGVPGVAKRLFGTLERIGVNVVLISQASSEHSVTFATMEAQASAAKAAIEDEFSRELRENRISSVDVQAPCSIIAAVGDGMLDTTGVSGRFFSALGDAKINVLAIAQGCSERNISAVVRTEESTRALRAVHAAFRLSHTTIRVGIIGMNELGYSLLKLLDNQRAVLRATFDIDLQVCAALGDPRKDDVVALRKNDDSSTDSVTIGAFDSVSKTVNRPKTAFRDETGTVVVKTGGLASMVELLVRKECTNHVIFDCTNDEMAGQQHAGWLRSGVDVVTANNTGLSGPKQQRDDIRAAQSLHGKSSAKYLREVTVGGGLPIISTLRTLLQSGDKIQRIDGIMSVSLSFIMFRISPPRDTSSCSEFDRISSRGAFCGHLTVTPDTYVGKPCTFTQAVKEAIALGLMEEDPTKDLNNEYTSRVLLVLARELGMDEQLEVIDIQNNSDKPLEALLNETFSYHQLSEELDRRIEERVNVARSRGCVLRHISGVDVREKEITIKIMEVPDNHVFAVTAPSCECVRFFTFRHNRYPLIVQGPSAGADSTASALLAELLHLMRGKASPRSLALTRSGSGTALQMTAPRQSSTAPPP